MTQTQITDKLFGICSMLEYLKTEKKLLTEYKTEIRLDLKALITFFQTVPKGFLPEELIKLLKKLHKNSQFLSYKNASKFKDIIDSVFDTVNEACYDKIVFSGTTNELRAIPIDDWELLERVINSEDTDAGHILTNKAIEEMELKYKSFKKIDFVYRVL